MPSVRFPSPFCNRQTYDEEETNAEGVYRAWKVTLMTSSGRSGSTSTSNEPGRISPRLKNERDSDSRGMRKEVWLNATDGGWGRREISERGVHSDTREQEVISPSVALT
jgi:hypothetical protein